MVNELFKIMNYFYPDTKRLYFYRVEYRDADCFSIYNEDGKLLEIIPVNLYNALISSYKENKE